MGPGATRVNLSRIWGPGRKVRRTAETDRKKGGFCSKGSLNIRSRGLERAAQPRRESLDSVQVVAVGGEKSCCGAVFIGKRERKTTKAPRKLNLIPGGIRQMLTKEDRETTTD